ncbi:MAG: hypothetical protein AABZ30_12980 [Myxococcota bacterium]
MADAFDTPIDELLMRGDADALARLAVDPSKDVAKQARRALHKLRSRGVAVPEPPAPPPRFAPTPTRVETDAVALASAADGGGQRAVWLVRDQTIYEARISETAGLVELLFGEAGRRQVRTIRDKLLALADLLVADVPPDYARWLMEEAYERTLAARRAVPPGFARARPALGPAERRFQRHPALDAVELAAELDDPAPFLDGPVVRTWAPEREALDRCALHLAEVDQSRIVVDQRQRDEQRAATLAREADAYFTPERRALWGLRLLDVAYLLHARRRDAEARRARTIADLFARADTRATRHVFARCFKLDRHAQPAIEQGATSPLIVPGVSPR